MVTNYPDLSAQNVFRIDIQKELKVDPGTETVEVWGEIEVTSPALVHARDLRLKSIQNLLMTVDAQPARGVGDMFASKYVYSKGQKNNYASIYVWDLSDGVQATGSHYINFLAMGE